MTKPTTRETQIAGNARPVWFAYPHGLAADMLRDARGVGRRFLSQEAAQRAAEKAR